MSEIVPSECERWPTSASRKGPAKAVDWASPVESKPFIKP